MLTIAYSEGLAIAPSEGFTTEATIGRERGAPAAKRRPRCTPVGRTRCMGARMSVDDSGHTHPTKARQALATRSADKYEA